MKFLFVFMDSQQLLNKLNSFNKNTLMETLDIEFIAIGEDYMTVSMPVNPNVHQPFGLLHGGASAALAETVGSSASAFLFADAKTQVIKGIELSINHVKSKKKEWYMPLLVLFTSEKPPIC